MILPNVINFLTDPCLILGLNMCDGIGWVGIY